MNELMNKIKSLSGDQQKKIMGEIVRFKDENEVVELLKNFGVSATTDDAKVLLDSLKGKVELFAADLEGVAGGRTGTGHGSSLGVC